MPRTRPLFECTYSRVIVKNGAILVQELYWPNPEYWQTQISIPYDPVKVQDLLDIAITMARQITMEKAVLLYGNDNEEDQAET